MRCQLRPQRGIASFVTQSTPFEEKLFIDELLSLPTVPRCVHSLPVRYQRIGLDEPTMRLAMQVEGYFSLLCKQHLAPKRRATIACAGSASAQLGTVTAAAAALLAVCVTCRSRLHLRILPDACARCLFTLEYPRVILLVSRARKPPSHDFRPVRRPSQTQGESKILQVVSDGCIQCTAA